MGFWGFGVLGFWDGFLCFVFEHSFVILLNFFFPFLLVFEYHSLLVIQHFEFATVLESSTDSCSNIFNLFDYFTSAENFIISIVSVFKGIVVIGRSVCACSLALILIELPRIDSPTRRHPVNFREGLFYRYFLQTLFFFFFV